MLLIIGNVNLYTFFKIPVKCFAITKKYLMRNIFLKYPDIGREI
jgi:hypothetical protein